MATLTQEYMLGRARRGVVWGELVGSDAVDSMSYSNVSQYLDKAYQKLKLQAETDAEEKYKAKYHEAITGRQAPWRARDMPCPIQYWDEGVVNQGVPCEPEPPKSQLQQIGEYLAKNDEGGLDNLIAYYFHKNP